ncbi:MAG: tRNA pseudouridine(38-40) synthase TruA [Acidimicrobiia bacterium]|nr:tRNA pseudouridine(38-40) synthase TruA [Acidimicrobiia bacterium]
MRRLRFTLSYDGTDFHGWQVQPGLPTVQALLESVLAEIEGAPVHVTASGRTDAGVHALAQVVSFDLGNPIPVENLRRAVNRLLPPSVRILVSAEAPPGFHARHHAIAKTYEYRIWRGETCSPFEQRYVYHHPYPLDLTPMHALAPLLEGEHEFSAFAASDETDALGRSKVRTIFSSTLQAGECRLVYRVRGSGFLKHMVRNIVGALLEAGKGNLTRDQLLHFLQPGCPDKAGPRAPARGLFLVSVEYP